MDFKFPNISLSLIEILLLFVKMFTDFSSYVQNLPEFDGKIYENRLLQSGIQNEHVVRL